MRAAATAFVDESFRRSVDGHGLFLLSAVIVPNVQLDEIGMALRRHVAPGQQRWHFRTESAASRRRFLGTLAGLYRLGVTASTYYCPTPSQRKSGRSRTRLLWSLMADLAQSDVRTLVLESRQDHNDRKDRREIHWAITAGVASASLAYRHDLPVQEPLLWLPDAIAGAVGISIADRSDELVSLLPAPLRQIRQLRCLNTAKAGVPPSGGSSRPHFRQLTPSAQPMVTSDATEVNARDGGCIQRQMNAPHRRFGFFAWR